MTVPTGQIQDSESLQNALLNSIHHADRQGANTLINDWARVNGYENLLTQILEPVLLKIGEEWQISETVTIAQAYVAGKIAEDVLLKIAEQMQNSAVEQTSKGPVVFGNIEDDYHSLGRKMVVTFLRINGYEVIDLGNDVTAKEFVDCAMSNNARVIGVSAMTMTTAQNIKKLRKEINDRDLSGKIQLAVGGAVFIAYPPLVKEVGGDGTARNAIDAIPLFDQLWKYALKYED